MIRTRVAPSPTGIVHVGTGYISLFNWAYARKNKGKFILRLEDTDVKRHVSGAEAIIDEGLAWLGLVPDEKYKQSERLDIYKKKAKELIDKRLAYEDEGAIRFKNPGDNLTFTDLVRGEITFPGSEITDFVIVRGDGMPLYNFVVVVDDIEMKISHIIRGEEHISNTPRQLALYKAFGVTFPKIAHLPLLRNPDRSKISKRENSVSLLWYRDKGYLPEALLNFFALLGWSHPHGAETFDLEEFVKVFDFDHIHKTGPVFDLAKLDWINGEYIRSLSVEDFVGKMHAYFGSKYGKDILEKVTPLIKDRIKKLSDIESFAGPLLDPSKMPEPLKITDFYAKHISNATITNLQQVKDWKLENINTAFGTAIQETKSNVGDYYMDVRGTIFGNRGTPPVNESVEILGKEKTIKQLKRGYEEISKKEN